MSGPQKPPAPPTPAERAMMERIRAEAKQDELNKQGAEKGSSTRTNMGDKPLKKGGSIKGFCRGGGIESRGKTKGQFV